MRGHDITDPFLQFNHPGQNAYKMHQSAAEGAPRYPAAFPLGFPSNRYILRISWTGQLADLQRIPQSRIAASQHIICCETSLN